MTTVSTTPTLSDTGARVLDFRQDFRRRGTPPRRKRKSVLLVLLRPLAVAVIVVALPTGLVYWVLTAPMFRLRNIDVGARPSRRVNTAWVRQTLAPLKGRNLVRALRSPTPRRGSVAIRGSRRSRSKKSCRTASRSRWRSAGPWPCSSPATTLAYADQDGRPIAPVATPAELEEARKAGLLVVSFVRDRAIQTISPRPSRWPPSSAGCSRTGRRSWRRSKSWERRTSGCTPTPYPSPSWSPRARWDPKCSAWSSCFPELSQRYSRIEAVDLRFSRRIVVQPAVQPSQCAPGAPCGRSRSLRILRSTL